MNVLYIFLPVLNIEEEGGHLLLNQLWPKYENDSTINGFLEGKFHKLSIFQPHISIKILKQSSTCVCVCVCVCVLSLLNQLGMIMLI